MFLMVLIILLLSSCSSAYRTLDDSTQQRLNNDLITGRANLDCRFSCMTTWLNALSRLKVLHDNGHWKQLALETQRIGYATDLSWYYLGRSAEGVNAKKAARTYYNISVEDNRSGHHCNNCNGHRFPQDALQRLSRLKSSTSRRINRFAASYPLFVNVEPSDAVIKVMNIGPKFTQGIKLNKGDYHLRLQKPGFKTINKTIKVKDSAVTVAFNLTPIEFKSYKQAGSNAYHENQATNTKPILNSVSTESASTFQKTKSSSVTATAMVIKNTELKAEPSLFSSVHRQLKRGEKVKILENLGDWIKVQTSQGGGYVYQDSLRKN